MRELENLVRRLAVLYAEETIGVDVIDAELAEAHADRRPADAAPAETLVGSAVERHLDGYFAAHDGRPAAARPLRPGPARGRAAADRASAGGDPRQPAQGGRHLSGLNRNTLRKKIRDLDIQVVRGL